MLLAPNENLVREEAAELDLGTERVRGTLLLTDQRIVFVARNAAGLFTAGTSRTLVNLDAHRLTAVFVDRPKLRLSSADRGVVTVEAGGEMAKFRVRGANSWRDSILGVRPTLVPPPPGPHSSAAPTSHPAHAAHSHPAPAVAPGTVVHTVEREVVLIRCRFCHTAVPERSGKCPHCGAPL